MKHSDITNPTILITGATRGIGFAAARQLAKRGAKVILASRDEARAKAAAASLGTNVSAIGLDITNPASIKEAVQVLEAAHGTIDVLINNAAILLDHYQSILELPDEMVTETLDTNVVGTFRLTRAMIPLLRRSQAPRIIIVSSGAGQLDGEPQAWAPAYSISKTALNMLTQQLSAALPGFMVNAMCPGWCRTEMGGENAPRSAEEGADTITWLSLDAPFSLRSKFIKDRQVIPW